MSSPVSFPTIHLQKLIFRFLYRFAESIPTESARLDLNLELDIFDTIISLQSFNRFGIDGNKRVLLKVILIIGAPSNIPPAQHGFGTNLDVSTVR